MQNARAGALPVIDSSRLAADTVAIRRGEPGDLAALADIELESARMFPTSTLPPELARPLPAEQVAAGIAESRVWVADGGPTGPVGFVLFEEAGACLHIAEMDVRPSFGRRGIGTRLLALAGPVARDRGLRFITLTTFAHIPWNAPFYARRGFTAIVDLVPFPHLARALVAERRRGLRQRVAMAKPAPERSCLDSVGTGACEHVDADALPAAGPLSACSG